MKYVSQRCHIVVLLERRRRGRDRCEVQRGVPRAGRKAGLLLQKARRGRPVAAAGEARLKNL